MTHKDDTDHVLSQISPRALIIGISLCIAIFIVTYLTLPFFLAIILSFIGLVAIPGLMFWMTHEGRSHMIRRKVTFLVHFHLLKEKLGLARQTTPPQATAAAHEIPDNDKSEKQKNPTTY